MAAIIKGYKVEHAPHSATAPTEWAELKGCIRNLPNFFPESDTVDTSTVDTNNATSIPGLPGGESYPFTVAVNNEFLTAHTAMVADQNDDEKGFFWLKVTLTNRGQTITGKFRTVDFLPTPEGAAGDLDEITWPVYPQGDLTVAAIA